MCVSVVGVEVNVCVCRGCQLDMEIRHNKQQFKHEHYIRGRHPAATSACGRQIRPTKLCVCLRVCLCVCDAADVTDAAPCLIRHPLLLATFDLNQTLTLAEGN